MKLYRGNRLDGLIEIPDDELAADFVSSPEYEIDWPLTRRLDAFLQTVTYAPVWDADDFARLEEAAIAEVHRRALELGASRDS